MAKVGEWPRLAGGQGRPRLAKVGQGCQWEAKVGGLVAIVGGSVASIVGGGQDWLVGGQGWWGQV